MANKKTSKKPKKLSIKDMPLYTSKKALKTKTHDPLKNLTDMKFISQALTECLMNADQEGFMEVFRAHILAQNISQLERKSKVRRSTIYAAISSKGNPTIGTIMELLKKRAA